jgi:hypothetical protein
MSKDRPKPKDRTQDWAGRPLTAEGRRFYRLRDSGYKGPIDQDGYPAGCLVCGKAECPRQGFAGKCST